MVNQLQWFGEGSGSSPLTCFCLRIQGGKLPVQLVGSPVQLVGLLVDSKNDPISELNQRHDQLAVQLIWLAGTVWFQKHWLYLLLLTNLFVVNQRGGFFYFLFFIYFFSHCDLNLKPPTNSPHSFTTWARPGVVDSWTTELMKLQFIKYWSLVHKFCIQLPDF